ncbi:hypothetical protein QTP86_015534, partial [Hemibagrus guttatus]
IEQEHVSSLDFDFMDRFFVNLQCGTKTSSDIALHFNPRYVGNSGHVVCNTLQNSCWGSEQRTNHTPLPKSFDFILTFLVNRDSYSVIVNGGHFLEYLHRLPVSRVNAISVDGGVEIVSIAFQNPAVSLNPKQNFNITIYIHIPPMYSIQIIKKIFMSPQVLPYKTILQAGLYPGRVITMQGFVNHNADKCVHLQYKSVQATEYQILKPSPSVTALQNQPLGTSP